VGGTGGRATFVGRAYELALLKDSLAAGAGRPWIVLAEGEPGMGRRPLLRPHPAQVNSAGTTAVFNVIPGTRPQATGPLGDGAAGRACLVDARLAGTARAEPAAGR
jgi:hypothetical protein